MNEVYLIVNCDRCGSISQLVLKGVNTAIFLCPVCLEGEIEYKVKQVGTQRHQGVIDGIHNLGSYISTQVKLSNN